MEKSDMKWTLGLRDVQGLFRSMLNTWHVLVNYSSIIKPLPLNSQAEDMQGGKAVLVFPVPDVDFQVIEASANWA